MRFQRFKNAGWQWNAGRWQVNWSPWYWRDYPRLPFGIRVWKDGRIFLDLMTRYWRP